ncbi:MAG TPA: translocation/assembly module TamB domain-containing protein, partial [Puia sp.]|nr:translocation/assembly module TamB domain-containing protein [Puia sp.]
PSIYSGTISTDSFDLGKFLDNEQLGLLSFDGKINGEGLTSKSLNATIDGRISRLHFNQYDYSNLIVNGTLAKSKFSGQIIANDSNLNATMNGLIDFSKHPYTINFYADVAKADLSKLHFTNSKVQFNGKLDFNFNGDNIDNFTGIARVYNATILKSGQRISFDSLIVNSTIAESNRTITLESNEFNGAFVGEFSIRDLPPAIQTFLNKYYPAYVPPAKTRPANQDFSFVINTKKIQDYIDLFDKKLKGFDNTTISGRISSKENLLDLNVDVPQLSYNNVIFSNVSIRGRGNFDSLSLQTDIGDVAINDSLHFPGTHIHLRSSNDLSDVQIVTSANQTLNSASLSGQVQTLSSGVHIWFNPSTFDINSKIWVVDKNGELTISKNLVDASNLRIHSGDQQLLVTTRPSTLGDGNDIHLEMKKINVGDITPFFVKSDRIEGIFTGTADISNPYRQPKVIFNGQADQFRLDNDSVGRLKVDGNYDTKTSVVDAHLNSDNRNYHFDINGIFSASDSTNAEPVNVNINLSDTKIGLLEKYLSGIFSNIKGFVTGKLQIIGQGNNLKYRGNVLLKEGELKVNYTQCTYRIPKMNVDLKDSLVDFGTFQITDKLDSVRHTAEITEAKLYHHAFANLRFDFAMNTNKLLLLDTKISDNNLFYGRVVGRASMKFTGPQENMQLTIKGEPNDSSNIYLPLTTSRESAQADFIVWKVYGKEMQVQSFDRKSSNINVKLDLTANNFANIFVILDPLTGDIIKTTGKGQLHLEVGTNEDLSIRGRYDITRGTYNFNLQSFIRKPFVFNRDADNYISWNGDPYDANINVQAIYEAENVHFSDLGIPNLGANAKGYRGPIWVIATLKDQLMKPTISFQIELPPNSPLKNDVDAVSALQAISNDPNELTKQASLLVAFDQFGPMSTSTTSFDVNAAATGIFVNSISGIISNQLTKQLVNFLRKVDPTLRVNFNATVYNGYNAAENTIGVGDPTRGTYDRTNLNLSIGKSFLNERLTFTIGNAVDVGLTTQQAQTSSFQFLPDVTAEYKLTNDGRVLASLFYRDSYNYLSVVNHTENRSGASISYQRSFDRLSELLTKKKKKKAKPKANPPANPDTRTVDENAGKQ